MAHLAPERREPAVSGSTTRSSPGCALRSLKNAMRAAARAYIYGRDYAVPEDLFALAGDVILHRIRMTYEALADGRRADDVLADLLKKLV